MIEFSYMWIRRLSLDMSSAFLPLQHLQHRALCGCGGGGHAHLRHVFADAIFVSYIDAEQHRDYYAERCANSIHDADAVLHSEHLVDANTKWYRDTFAERHLFCDTNRQL